MLNFAIGWAFLISFAASPGVKILSAFVDPVVFRTIPPYQGVLSNIFANYWIPALLIYLVLKALRAERFLRPTRGIHTLFGISNAILCVYALLRVFTATVEGGGATFALASMSFLAIVPALVGLVVATIWLATTVTTIRMEPVSSGPVSPLRSAGSIAAMVFLLPPFAFFGWVYAANAEKINKLLDAKHARVARLDELCRTKAKAEVLRIVSGAKSVLFQLINNATYSTLERVEYVELRNSYARTGEPGFHRITKKPGESVFVQGTLNVVTQPVVEATAEYEVSVRLLETKAETEQGIAVEEMTIRDRRSGETLAVFTAVSERSLSVTAKTRFCGIGSDYVAYQQDSIAYVLGLMDEKASTEFAKRMAALKPVGAEK